MDHMAFLQEWTEYERGWGQRPDGYSLHLTKNSALAYVNSYNAQLPPGPAPDEYTIADGPPFPVLVPEHLYQQICDKPEGIRYFRGGLILETNEVGTRSVRERDDTSQLPFLEKCVRQLAKPEDLSAFIEAWNAGSQSTPLQVAVGASDAEWALLQSDPKNVYQVLYERLALA